MQVRGDRDHRAQVARTRDMVNGDRCADVLEAPDVPVPVLRGAPVALDREMQQPLGRHANLVMRRGDDHRSRSNLTVGADDLDTSAGAELLLQCGVKRTTEALGHPAPNLAGSTEDRRAVAQDLRLERVEPEVDEVHVHARAQPIEHHLPHLARGPIRRPAVDRHGRNPVGATFRRLVARPAVARPASVRARGRLRRNVLRVAIVVTTQTPTGWPPRGFRRSRGRVTAGPRVSGLSPQRLTPLARDLSPRSLKCSARATIDWARKPTCASFTRPSVRRCEPRPAGARPSRSGANAGERSARVGAHMLASHSRPSLVMMVSPKTTLAPGPAAGRRANRAYDAAWDQQGRRHLSALRREPGSETVASCRLGGLPHATRCPAVSISPTKWSAAGRLTSSMCRVGFPT